MVQRRTSALETLKDLFARDFGRKVVALVLAVGLWFLISKILRVEIQKAPPVFIVPSQLEGLLNSRDVSDSLVIEVGDLVVLEPKDWAKGQTGARMLLSGPRALLEGEGELRVSARYTVPPNFCETVSPREFKLDQSAILINGLKPKQGIRIEIVEAPVISLARRERRRIRIDYRNFRVVGTPKDGWALDDKASQVIPKVAEVTISGPAEEVSKIEADPGLLKFEPIKIDRADSLLEASVSLERPVGPQLLQLEVPPNRVEVAVKLNEVREDKELANLRVVPLYLDELIASTPGLRDLPSSESPILPPLKDDDQWEVNVVLSAPRTFWDAVDPEQLRNRIFLWVNLRQMIAGRARIKKLQVEYCGLRGPQNETWPAEVQFKKVNPDLIPVSLHE